MEKIAKQSRLQSNLLQRACIAEKDVLIIWDALAYYVRDELSRKRGVVLPGFGTFTYVEQRLETGTNGKQLLRLQPFFLLSERFAQLHAVAFSKEHVNAAIPVSRLNYAAVSETTGRKYSREIVELVLGEAFTAIDHFLRIDGTIQVPFNGLGLLRVLDVNPKPKKQVSFDFAPVMKQHVPVN